MMIRHMLLFLLGRYIKMELRYNETERARAIFEKFVQVCARSS